MTRFAPIVRLALSYSAGVAAGLAGAPIWIAPLGLLLGLAAPVRTSSRPAPRAAGVLAVAAGLLAAQGVSSPDRSCPDTLPGATGTVEGRLLARPRTGSAPLVLDGGCGTFTLVVSTADTARPAGRPLRIRGTWRSGRVRPWLRAEAVEVGGTDEAAGLTALRWAAVRWRDGLVERLLRLYGERGPLVSALVLARREGLDPDLRSAFATTGIAHLLAISGFHVGLVAGILFGVLRASGRGRKAATAGAALLSWAYVGLIGFPDAACRAALILTCLALSRARGYPPSRWGPLGAAALALVLLDPMRVASPGFQLSFAGAAGLVAWARSSEGALRRLVARVGRPVGRPLVLPKPLVSGLAAGIAATLATLPIVAWHFERVSLVGVPLTLVATPLVVLALPGALATLAMDFVAPGPAAFLAGGVGLLLEGLVRLTEAVSTLPWASAWVGRPTVAAGCTGVALAMYLARAPRIGPVGRRRLLLLYAAAGVVGWPIVVALDGLGRLELLVIDVGQGDAIALRTPRGRWLLVDAGPPVLAARSAHPVVRTLRARGVRRLHTLVLTHPDLDHIGGAPAVLEHLRPDRIVDPMLAAPKSGYADLVERAAAASIPWRGARTGDRLDVDGVAVEVLHPSELPTDASEGNAASIVLLVAWQGFSALLTGDAYVEAERVFGPAAGDVDVLKVGHHGSDTSTDSAFLDAVRPEVALLSLGRDNRYGHPSPRVLRRLERAGAAIHRTDEQGTVRVVVRRDGSYVVRAGGR